MKKNAIVVAFAMVFSTLLSAQSTRSLEGAVSIPITGVEKQVFISVGPGFGSHQNQVVSLTGFSGIGGGFELGFSKRSSNYLKVSLAGRANILAQKGGGSAQVFEALNDITWLKGLPYTGKNKYYVGGNLETSGTLRLSNELGNNTSTFLFVHTLAAMAKAERPMGDRNWVLGGEFSLGLLSWVKKSDGYAFSAPQRFLTEGKFNYDDDVTLKPYKYGGVKPVGVFHNLRTNISLIKHGHRVNWGGVYEWQVKAYDPYTHGQYVNGNHLVKFFFGFKFGMRKNRTK